MKRLVFLIASFLVVFGASGCIGDKIPGLPHRNLNVTLNENKQLCFYIDDFLDSDDYYLIGIDTVGRQSQKIVDYTWQIKNGDPENYHEILDYMWQRNDGTIVKTNGLIGQEIYNADAITQIFRAKIPLSDIDNSKKCIPFGMNLSTDKNYVAKELNPAYKYKVSFYAKKYKLEDKDDDYIVFDTLFSLSYNKNTKKYDIKLQK